MHELCFIRYDEVSDTGFSHEKVIRIRGVNGEVFSLLYSAHMIDTVQGHVAGELITFTNETADVYFSYYESLSVRVPIADVKIQTPVLAPLKSRVKPDPAEDEFDLRPGSKVYYVTFDHKPRGRYATIATAGRKWLTFEGGFSRINLETKRCEGLTGLRSQIFPSQANYERITARDTAWIDFFNKVNATYRPPEHLTEAMIQQVREILKI